MAKRVRTTGLPIDQAHVGATVARLRNYTGYQCSGCTLAKTCDPSPPPNGPWEVMSAEPDQVVQCKVTPTIRMVPVTVRRIKEKRVLPQAPRQEKLEERHILLDANVLIEGAKGTFKGIIHLILEPPEGFHYHTTEKVAEECRYLPGVDRALVFEHITVHPSPARIDDSIMETHGDGITPPSEADAALFQLAKEDPRFTILVSHDRFHRWTGLARTLGIGERLKVYAVPDFIKYARRHR